MGPQACRQSFVSCESPLPPGSRGLFCIIQLTHYGRLPVALHYDPIQSARLPASTTPIASAHRTGKRTTTAPNHRRFCKEDYVFQAREREKKKMAELCLYRDIVQNLYIENIVVMWSPGTVCTMRSCEEPLAVNRFCFQ